MSEPQMSEPQKIFAVQYHYVPELAAQRDVHRADHRAFLVALGPAMVAAGAYVDHPDGALLLIQAATAADVVDLLDGDPFKQHGLIASTIVNEWSCAIGVKAAAIRGDEA